jgi:hypothetical protein
VVGGDNWFHFVGGAVIAGAGDKVVGVHKNIHPRRMDWDQHPQRVNGIGHPRRVCRHLHPWRVDGVMAPSEGVCVSVCNMRLSKKKRKD